jgi:uncharacterized Zn finger protein (UPF0148 family)
MSLEPPAPRSGSIRWDCVEDMHNYHNQVCRWCGCPITDGAKYCREHGQAMRRWRARVKEAADRAQAEKAANRRRMVHRAWLELRR